MTQESIVCSRCGRSGDDEETSTWSMSVDGESVSYMCPACVRDNVRNIESKLDETWW